MSTIKKRHTYTSKQWRHVAVLAGGRSSEREVSLKTGQAVFEALTRLGYEVSLIDPQTDLLSQLTQIKADVVYNALHGTYGEDGCLQGLLEWIQIPYTGSGVVASALAMNKDLSRQAFQAAGVPVAEGCVWIEGTALPKEETLPSKPWVFKPVAEGSSVGVYRCESLDELHRCMQSQMEEVEENGAEENGAEERSNKREWLIESWLEGVEISVMVYEGEAWGGVEIQPAHGWYDFDAKYQRGDTYYYCPPRLSSKHLEPIYRYAERVYQTLRCRGVCRIDFITTPQETITLEINTLPGMTETSLVPKIAENYGVDFDRLIALILSDARRDYE